MKEAYETPEMEGLTQLNVRVRAPAKILIKFTAKAARTPIEALAADALELYLTGKHDPSARNRRAACQREFRKLSGGKRISFFDDALAFA